MWILIIDNTAAIVKNGTFESMDSLPSFDLIYMLS